MDKQMAGRMNCFICGELVTLKIAKGWAGQCSRCAMVDDLLAASRRRKDSIGMLVDLGAMMMGMRGVSATGAAVGPAPFMMSFGFADHAAHLRMSIPAATIRAIKP